MDTEVSKVKENKFVAFKEKLQHQLSTKDVKFLMGTFRKASTFFFAFAILEFGFSAILDKIFIWVNSPVAEAYFHFIMVAVVIISFIPGIWCQWKWSSNPLTNSKVLPRLSYFLMVFRFLTAFLIISRLYTAYLHDPSSSINAYVASLLLNTGVFALAWLIYLVPVFIAWFVIKRNQAIKLYKFVWKCMAVYVICFLIILISIFSGFINIWLIIPGLIIFGVVCVLVCASPIITLYRFRVTATAIDYDNEEEKKKWSSYFVFSILEDLFYTAYRIARVAIYALGSR